MTINGYDFRDRRLIIEALTHSSYSNEHSGIACNERLEFLGDSILGFLAAEHLFKSFPSRPEGELTKIRAGYVCESSLAEAARTLGLGGLLRLGCGEVSAGGAQRDSLLSDAFEAVLGAMYLDGGIEPCRELVRKYILSMPEVRSTADAKTLLQERVQAKGLPTPTYRLVSEEGPDHDKLFLSEVIISGASAGQGTGKSKKLSEQEAARDALKSIDS